jgi:hypothetical protein
MVSLRGDLEQRLPYPMADYQRQCSTIILESVAKGGNIEIPILMARRSGKTDMTALTAMTVGVYYCRFLREDIDIGFINPTKTEQGIMVTRDRLRRRCLDVKGYLEIGLDVETVLDEGRKTADFIFIGPDHYEARIRAISADAHANEKGAGFQLSFFEQVEDMDEDVMKSILFPMAAGQVLQSCRVLAGTPSLEVKNNYFYDRTRTLRYPQFVDDKFAAHWRPDYGGWVAKERDRLGEDSDVYKTQYRCIWVVARNRLADRDKMLSLAKDYTLEPTRDRIAGTDVAKDVDSTVCTVIEREGADHHILAWYEAENIDYETQADELKMFLQDYQVTANMVDATGVGDPVVDMLSLRCRGVCETIPFKFTTESHDSVWKVYEPELRHDRLHYPKTIQDDGQKRCRDRFIEQHLIAERKVMGNRIKVEKPPRKGSHIDYVISSALAVYCSVRGRRSEPDAVGGG